MDERCAKTGFVDDARQHRWGKQVVPMLHFRIVRRDRRGDHRYHCEGEQEKQQATRHARTPPNLARGSAIASKASASSVPMDRKNAPAAAHPAIRNKSRARSASYINRPSPGHAVTTSTTNDPLKSD